MNKNCSLRKGLENREKKLQRFCVPKISHIRWRAGHGIQGAVLMTEGVGVWQSKKVRINLEIASVVVYNTRLGLFKKILQFRLNGISGDLNTGECI